MANINLNNYEAYLLDFYEGNLSRSEILALKNFLHLHPHFDIDLTDTFLPELSVSNDSASFKESLKKQNLIYSDEYLIDFIEGNLNAKQNVELELQLKTDSELKKSLNLLRQTILVVDNQEVFSQKNALLKSEEQFLFSHTSLNYLENQLSPDEKLEFEKNLEFDSKIKLEYNLFQSTILKADEEIVFNYKKDLKRETKVVVLFQRRVLSSLVAAALLIVGSVYIFNQFYKVELSNTSTSLKADTKTNSSKNNSETKEDELAPKLETAMSFNQTKISNSKSFAKKLDFKKEEENKNELVVKTESKYETDEKASIAQVDIVPIEVLAQTSETPVLNESTKKEIAESIHTELTHFSSLEELAEVEDENTELVLPTKYPFWRKAVQLAKQANNLGLKSINGKEKENDQYLLSFNSFSIEKK